MAIFWRLLFGHLLADFTFQTNFINAWKRSSFRGMLAHCGTHPIAYVVLTWPFLADYWIDTPHLRLNGWWCIAVIFAAHLIEDQWRVYEIFKYKVPDNTLYFLWDQFIHYAVIFAVIPLGLMSQNVSFFPERWPVLGCLFVAVTHGATVLVYFIEKDLYGLEFPGFEEKYLGMAERLVLALSFLLPKQGWLVAAPAWLALMYVVRSRRYLDLSWLSYYLGGGISVACGLLGRFIYYS